jgi:hypothetical protein
MGVPGGREKYYQALYTRLQQFVNVSDDGFYRCIPLTQVPQEKKTALILHVSDQMAEAHGDQARMPPKWLLGAVVQVIVRVNANDDSPADGQLNVLLDQVEKALERQPNEAMMGNADEWNTTLGGLVQRCWIDGPIVMPSTGESSDLADALVPVVMRVVGSKKGS